MSKIGGRREGLDAAYDTKPDPQGGRDDQPPKMMRQPTEKKKLKGRGIRKRNQET